MKRTQQRRWSLYRRPRGAAKGTRWERISQLGTSKQGATRIFQNQLWANTTGSLDPGFEYQLKWFVPEIEK